MAGGAGTGMPYTPQPTEQARVGGKSAAELYGGGDSFTAADGSKWGSQAEYLAAHPPTPDATAAPDISAAAPGGSAGGGGGGAPIGGLVKAAPAAAADGAGPTGMTDAPTLEAFSGPNTLRQGIGQRNPPNLTPMLTGLRSIY